MLDQKTDQVENSVKDTKDLRDSILKPKKNGNSIKKNKACSDVKKPTASAA